MKDIFSFLDPYHEDKNYEFNVFLPVVNNLNASKFFNVTGIWNPWQFPLIYIVLFLLSYNSKLDVRETLWIMIHLTVLQTTIRKN